MKNSLRNYSLNIPEEEYHNLPAWSHSAIARYAKDGFSSLNHLQDKIEPTPSMRFGSLFDSMITRGKKTLDDYYVMDVSIPDAERKALDYISTCTSDQFETLDANFIHEKSIECGYQARWGVDAHYNHLVPFSKYYNAKVSGKNIVSEDEWQDALQMWSIFRNDAYLKTLFGTKNTSDVEYLYQLQFQTDYTLPSGRTVTVKIMPDLLVINHIDKTIQPVDLKTSSIPGWQFKDNFIKFRYDIQASLYTDILEKIILEIPDYKDYYILPYLFTDISRTDKVPVTYEYDPRDLSQEQGLSFGDYSYRGWKALLDEILFYREKSATTPSYIRKDGPNNLIELLEQSKTTWN